MVNKTVRNIPLTGKVSQNLTKKFASPNQASINSKAKISQANRESTNYTDFTTFKEPIQVESFRIGPSKLSSERAKGMKTKNDENNINVPNTSNQSHKPLPIPNFHVKLSEYEKLKEHMETPRVNKSKVKHMFVMRNDEVEIRHTLAQDLMKLINKNEKSLAETRKGLNKFICEGKVSRSVDTKLFTSKFREAWADRMKVISDIFDKICLVNKEGECDSQFDIKFRTPATFERSLLFLED